MSELYYTFFYTPLYNTLVFLFKFSPAADAGIVVVMLTLVVRFILYPLSKKAIQTQARLQELNPRLVEIREKYKNDQQEQARQTMALYKEEKVNPFSGIFVILLQLPVMFALYQIFFHSGLPAVNAELLYSFVPVPEHVNIHFLNSIDIIGKSILLALLAAVSSYFQLRIAAGHIPPPKGNAFSDNLNRTMQTQMKYLFPVIVLVISYSTSAAVALYWFTTNLFTIAQEIVVRRKLAQAGSSK